MLLTSFGSRTACVDPLVVYHAPLAPRWQDVLPQLQPGHYDGIFFDTYGEYYAEVGQPGIRAFHQHLPQLLSPTGVYSYFNGFASDSLFFHMVYGRCAAVG